MLSDVRRLSPKTLPSLCVQWVKTGTVELCGVERVFIEKDDVFAAPPPRIAGGGACFAHLRKAET